MTVVLPGLFPYLIFFFFFFFFFSVFATKALVEVLFALCWALGCSLRGWFHVLACLLLYCRDWCVLSSIVIISLVKRGLVA